MERQRGAGEAAFQVSLCSTPDLPPPDGLVPTVGFAPHASAPRTTLPRSATPARPLSGWCDERGYLAQRGGRGGGTSGGPEQLQGVVEVGGVGADKPGRLARRPGGGGQLPGGRPPPGQTQTGGPGGGCATLQITPTGGAPRPE